MQSTGHYTPFKVIQGHLFRYQSKARMRLVIMLCVNLLSCTGSEIRIIGPVFAVDRGCLSNTLVRGEPLNSGLWNLT